MFDPDQVPLSTSEGRRPSSTAGDRMMVGLAVIALVGGVLIAVSRVLPQQSNETSQATVSPRPSARTSSSGAPSAVALPARTWELYPDFGRMPPPPDPSSGDGAG